MNSCAVHAMNLSSLMECKHHVCLSVQFVCKMICDLALSLVHNFASTNVAGWVSVSGGVEQTGAGPVCLQQWGGLQAVLQCLQCARGEGGLLGLQDCCELSWCLRSVHFAWCVHGICIAAACCPPPAPTICTQTDFSARSGAKFLQHTFAKFQPNNDPSKQLNLQVVASVKLLLALSVDQ